MKIINSKYNTNPLFVHAQGGSHKTNSWKNIVDLKPTINKNTLSSDVTILTFANGDTNYCLIEQLESNEVPYINVIKNKIDEWKNKYKIKYLVDYIDNVTTPYILCLDSLDVLCTEDLSDLIPRFKKHNIDILYNAGKTNYPKIPQKDEGNINSKFRYINAGCFIGKTEAVKDFYTFIYEKNYNDDYGKLDDSEQVRVRVSRQNYHKKKHLIKADSECTIFQTLNMTENEFDGETLTIIK